MIVIYKMFRYFVFLILGIYTILFYFSESLRPFPDFADRVDKFKTQHFSQASDLVRREEMLVNIQQQSAMIFQAQMNLIDSFTNDLRFPLVISEASQYQFNDLDFLYEEYFLSNKLIKDLLLEKNGQTFYKKNNIYTRNPIRVSIDVNSIVEGFKLIFILDSNLFQNILSSSRFDISLISYKDQLFYTDTFMAEHPDFTPSELEFLDDAPVKKLRKNKEIYRFAITDYFDAPVTLYMVHKPEFFVNWGGMFYYILSIVIWFIALGIDRVIARILTSRSRIKEYEKTYSSIDAKTGEEYDIDDTLTWLDRFIKVETLSEADGDKKNTKHNKKK